MLFGVERTVVQVSDARVAQRGTPRTEMEARFDLRYCVAAGWVRGRFTFDELQRSAFTDPQILALRARVDLVVDPERRDFDGAWLQISYADGSTERTNVDAFRGCPGNPVTDLELSDVFRTMAQGRLSKSRCSEIIDAVWTLDSAPSVDVLMGLLQADRAT